MCSLILVLACGLQRLRLMSSDYTQVAVPSEWRCPSKAWTNFTKEGLSPTTVMEFMAGIGANGSIGAP